MKTTVFSPARFFYGKPSIRGVVASRTLRQGILLLNIAIILSCLALLHSGCGERSASTPTRLISPMSSHMTASDLRAWTLVRTAYEKGNARRLNRLVSIGTEDLRFDVHVPPIVKVRTEVYITLVLQNMSERDIVIFSPYIKRLTLESAAFDGVYVDDYALSWDVENSNWGRLLSPSQYMSVSIGPISIENAGQYRLRFSLMLPQYSDFDGAHWQKAFHNHGIAEKNIKVKE